MSYNKQNDLVMNQYAATSKPLRNDKPFVSLVIPVYNEENMFIIFLDAIHEELDSKNVQYEIIFINDGSTDNTLPRLVERSKADPLIKIINLSRNFGKEAALSAGIDFSRGDVVIPMDVDLQDPPHLIPEFISKWQEGYDVVYGLRASRISDSMIKRTTAGFFYRVFNRISEHKIPENTGDFRLIDRKVVETLKRLPERNRFMKGLFSWVGFNTIGVSYERQPRQADETSWKYWKLWNFAIDGIVGFSTAPLRVWVYIGALVAMLSFLYGSFIIIKVLLTGIDVPGYASMMIVILFLGGIQLLSMGILGEYVGRLFTEVKSRPIYIIDTVFKDGVALE